MTSLISVFRVCASIVISALTICAPLVAKDVGDMRTVDALMVRFMSTYKVPGAALASIKNRGIVLEKGYGVRDVDHHALVTTRTVFNIDSISKSFTALGIAQLVSAPGRSRCAGRQVPA